MPSRCLSLAGFELSTFSQKIEVHKQDSAVWRGEAALRARRPTFHQCTVSAQASGILDSLTGWRPFRQHRSPDSCGRLQVDAHNSLDGSAARQPQPPRWQQPGSHGWPRGRGCLSGDWYRRLHCCCRPDGCLWPGKRGCLDSPDGRDSLEGVSHVVSDFRG